MRAHVACLFTLLVGCGGNVTFVADGDDGSGAGGPGSGGPGSGGANVAVGQSGSTDIASVGSSGDVAPDGGTSGAGGSSTVGTIECFGSVCDAGSEQCCASQGGASCQALDAPCNGISLTCSDASTCDGDQVCCAHGFQGGQPIAECRDNCGGGGMGGGGIQLCSSDAECLNGKPCVQGFGGLNVCGMGGPGGGMGPGGG